MSDKILIVGGNAGGAAAAARLRRLDEKSEIVIFEKGEHVSFASCGLPYYIGGIIDREELLVQTPESLESRFDIEVRTNIEVVDIYPDKKEIMVEDSKNSRTYTETYDKLILSPGAEPVEPPIEGIEETSNVFTLRKIPDADVLKEKLNSNRAEKAVVVGAGFIGLEMVENLKKQGLEVKLVEMMDQVMPTVDYDIAAMVQNRLREKGVDLYLNDKVLSVEPNDGSIDVALDSGKILSTDFVLLSTGVRPNTTLAEKAGLDLGETGGIKVNEYLETSKSDIYAIGDAIETVDCVTEDSICVPLAGPASKQARIVANNIKMEDGADKYECSIGTFIVKIFDLTLASTGKNEKELEGKGFDYEKTVIFSKSHAEYYPGASPLWLKLIFHPETGKIYGGQMIGEKGVDKRIDVLATAIKFGKSVFDLQKLDLAYAPPYSLAKDPINMAGFAAGNMINGLIDTIHWQDIQKLDSEDVAILDVRKGEELKEEGYLENSIHIPINELRDRLNEVPSDKEIICHCKCGLRSYIAGRFLQQKGYEVRNLSGGYGLVKAIERDRDARGLEKIWKT